MTSDIVMELPSWCDDCETWHQEFIWAHADGTYSSCDSDGDHEPIDEADIPSWEEHERLWREYTEWVLERGEDPLGNFFVRYSIKVKERWPGGPDQESLAGQRRQHGVSVQPETVTEHAFV